MIRSLRSAHRRIVTLLAILLPLLLAVALAARHRWPVRGDWPPAVPTSASEVGR